MRAPIRFRASYDTQTNSLSTHWPKRPQAPDLALGHENNTLFGGAAKPIEKIDGEAVNSLEDLIKKLNNKKGAATIQFLGKPKQVIAATSKPTPLSILSIDQRFIKVETKLRL